MDERILSATDRILAGAGRALETLFARAPSGERDYPGEGVQEAALSDSEKRHAAGLMRVNHVGEVCAQALYHSQALTARDHAVRERMRQCAEEETEHLAWCERRLDELGGRRSALNPLWYAGSFAIGVAAGVAGDRWSLGFVAETEKQVTEHLEGHLGELPQQDRRSREVVARMREDENRHGEQAREAGARELPGGVKELMRCAARVMTRTAYRV